MMKPRTTTRVRKTVPADRPARVPSLRAAALLAADDRAAASVRGGASDETFLTTEDLSRRFNVSTKTVDRWRTRGLASRRMVVGNRRRIGFRAADVDRFVSDHADEVARGARFTQVTDAERVAIVDEVRRFSEEGVAPGKAARDVAATVGRSVETVREAVRAHNRRNPDSAVYPHAFAPMSQEFKHDIYQRARKGASIEKLSREYGRNKADIERIVSDARFDDVLSREIEYVGNPSFDDDDAAIDILGPAPEPRTKPRLSKAPPGLPPYLASLYAVPLLTPQQEAHHFRKMNYLKHQAARLRARLTPQNATPGRLDVIEGLLREANEVKDVLIRSNLRLVVSIAKKNIRSGRDFFEMVSDGNMSLIRAIEKFDYSRGFKLSTYATWAIRRNFARSIPAENTQLDRFRTGNDELFHHSQDQGSSQFEQERVHRQQHQALMQILHKLQERERDILMCRYGLNVGDEPLTLEQVGARFGVTKERIRQLETRALNKLRTIASEEKLDIPGI